MKPWILCLHVLVAALFVPRFDAITRTLFVKSHPATRGCIANLKQIDSAKEQYAMDHRLENGAYVPLTGLFGPHGYIMHIPACWEGGVYSYGPHGGEPTCSLGEPQRGRPCVVPANHRLVSLPTQLR
jgi:hypothetical protein